MPIHSFRLVAVAAALFTCHSAFAQSAAETIYHGGIIITVNELQPEAQAVAIQDGKIIAVGYEDEVIKLKGPHTRLVNLQGKTMLPGFIDPHGHVFNTGIQALSANLLPRPDGGVNSVAELQDALRDWAKANDRITGEYRWIIGFGYDDAQLKEQRHPTKEELDAVSTELPIVIVHQSGHLATMNSKALELSGITADTQAPPGGVIRRKADSNEPNGVLEETAFFDPVFKLLGKLDANANQTLFLAGVNLYKSFGYTTAQEGRAAVESTKTMQAVAEAGKLDIDVAVYPDIAVDTSIIEPTPHYTKHFRIAGAKLTLDGSPQGKTAWLTEPYYKAPEGQTADYKGYAQFKDEQVQDYVELAMQKNWQLLTHVNGDAAIDQYLNVMRHAEDKLGMADRRFVAIHAQTAREDQVQAFKDLGIIPSFFPMHTFYWGDWHRDSVLGPERAESISPTGWALARDMIFTSHHDAPVAMPDAMRVIASTVNRVSRSGKVIGPQHRTTVLTAIKAHTLWAAYQYFEEKEKGSIEVGKLADFVVLSQNPLTIDPQNLDQIKVLETIKQGRSVFKRQDPNQVGSHLKSCAESESCMRVATTTLNHASIIDVHAHDH